MSKRRRPSTVSEKTNEVKKKQKKYYENKAQLEEQGFEMLDQNTRFAYQWMEPSRASAVLNFHHNAPKAQIYLSQKPLEVILDVLRRRAVGNADLLQFVKPSLKWIDRHNPDSHAYARILTALAVKVRIIANGRFDGTFGDCTLRDAISYSLEELAEEFQQTRVCGINPVEKLLTHMIFSVNDEEILRKHLQSTVVCLGEVLVCDEKLWRFTGLSSGWVRLVVSKPDRVGHWFYTSVVKLANDRYYCLYYRLHRTQNDKANGQAPIPVDEIGRDWIGLMDLSDSEYAHTFFVADSYYMSAAMRDVVKESGRSALIALPPERWTQVTSLMSPLLSKAGDSATLYNESTDEVR
jgi:hypothetical protein